MYYLVNYSSKIFNCDLFNKIVLVNVGAEPLLFKTLSRSFITESDNLLLAGNIKLKTS